MLSENVCLSSYQVQPEKGHRCQTSCGICPPDSRGTRKWTQLSAADIFARTAVHNYVTHLLWTL